MRKSYLRMSRFFIEGKEGNVLYTGDIRLTRTDIELMTALQSNGR